MEHCAPKGVADALQGAAIVAKLLVEACSSDSTDALLEAATQLHDNCLLVCRDLACDSNQDGMTTSHKFNPQAMLSTCLSFTVKGYSETAAKPGHTHRSCWILTISLHWRDHGLAPCRRRRNFRICRLQSPACVRCGGRRSCQGASSLWHSSQSTCVHAHSPLVQYFSPLPSSSSAPMYIYALCVTKRETRMTLLCSSNVQSLQLDAHQSKNFFIDRCCIFIEIYVC